MRTRSKEIGETKPWRLLLWTAVAGLLFGLLGLGEIAEDGLRTARNSLHSHKASGEIVVVRIDNASLRKVGRWPWPRRYHAQLTDKLTQAGAKRILFDVQFYGPTNAADDRLFASSLQRSGRVVLAAGRATGPDTGPDKHMDDPPLPLFSNYAGLGTIYWWYNYQNAVLRVPYSVSTQNGTLQSFSSLLSGRTGATGTEFMPDYSLDPSSIPTLSASEVISGRFDPAMIRGRDILIGSTTDVIGDMYFVPGTGQMGGVFVHAIAAETLTNGTPVYLGWWILYAAALLVAGLSLFRLAGRHQILAISLAGLLFLIGPSALEAQLINLDVTPALLVLSITMLVLVRRLFKSRGLVDSVSGLPNLTALKAHRAGRDQALIAARILNYAEIVANLPPKGEAQLVDQIVSRLSVGAPSRVHYQGDGGIFAWFDDAATPFSHHLEALYALFRTPVRVGQLSIDLSVAFGVEAGSSRSLANRLGSALVAAEEAAHDGLKWKYFDPHALQDASWKLSMLSQLDDAIDKGEVWVAYQPKINLKTRKIIGAEALARWTHPEKGPIAAAEFVAAAEQHDRIGKLTTFVLDQAIAAAASLSTGGRAFAIAVNLSGRLLADRSLVGRVAILLERHGLDPSQLTLELTETAALAGSGDALDLLAQLRELGVHISIDDYGTGLSTLDYLKRVPANEIKIDQTFIKGMTENRSERLMVQSTIALAHSLDRQVVAEGVESREALELLAEMECDIAQGFIIGRPMSLDSIGRRWVAERSSRVA